MNSGWYPLIFGLLYLVVHVASILAKEANKRKERERMMEQAERRRMAEARLEIPAPGVEADQASPVAWGGPGPVLSPAPSTGQRASRVDDLATRRKQQLEQMRARQIGGPSQQTRTTPVPGRGMQQSPPPSQLPTDRDRMRREASTHAEQQARAIRQRAALAKAQKLQQAQREADQRRRAELAEIETTVSEPIKPHAVAAISQVHAPLAIMRHLKDRNTLRELIVLKEIIDPPLALRTNPL